MEMSTELKENTERLVEIFLDTMPEEQYKKYAAKKLHHQLSYFYCWAVLLKEDLS